MRDKSDTAATRRRRLHIACCLLPQTVFVLFAVGLWGGGLWLLLPLGFLMLLVPILDRITNWQDAEHFEKGEFSGWQVSLLAWNPRVYAGLYIASLTYSAINARSFSGPELAILIGTLGLFGGIGFAAAHELMHAEGRVDRNVQSVLTVFLFYPHYKIIHLHSHHRYGVTPEDQNTAWMNESIYAYIVRTIPGSMLRCWQIETKRNDDGGNQSFVGRLLKNRMLAYGFAQVALAYVIFLAAGAFGLVFYIAQVVVAHLVFESVNYMQHYGLLRKPQKGRYERTNATHSWDTYAFFSSYITFRVGHHSFHHLAVEPYYLLDAEPDAPKLPVGYFWAIPVAFVPFLWRRLIHPRFPTNAERSDPEVSGVRSRPGQADDRGRKVA